MGGSARSGKYWGNDGVDTAYGYYFAAVILWWDKYDVYFLCTRCIIAAFVLY